MSDSWAPVPPDPLGLLLALGVNTADLIILSDVSGKLIYVSPSVTDLLGWRLEDLIGTYGYDYIHPDDAPLLLASNRKVLEGGKNRHRARLRAVSGDYFWMEKVSGPMRDTAGRIIGVAGTWRDISALVRLEQENAQAQQRYRLLAENSSDLVYLRDAEGIVLWVAPSIRHVLGYEPEEFVGTDAARYARGATFAEIQAFRDRIPRDGTPVNYLTDVQAADGSIRHMAATQRAAFQDGELAGFVVAMRAIDDLVAAQRDVEADRARLQATMDSMLDPLVVLAPIRDEIGRLVDWLHVDANRAAAIHTHREVAELIGCRLGEIVPGQARSGLYEHYERVLLTGEPMILDSVPYPDEQQGGLLRLFDMRGVKIGEAVAVTFRDVTEREQAAAAIAASEALFRAAAESAPIGMAMTDPKGRFQMTNPALGRLLGRSPEWLAAHRLEDVVLPKDRPALRKAAASLASGQRETVSGRLRLLRADGAVASTKTAAVNLPGDPPHILLQVVDLTREVEAREALAYQAMHDSLTGLRNREWLMEILDVELQSAARNGEQVGVFFVDLDNFKLVNDSLGHVAGDEVLRIIAARLSQALPPGGQLARFGGDEFVVVMPASSGLAQIERTAEALSSAITVPLNLQGHPILPTASIGIAMSRPGSTAESLLRDTDSAVFRAKEHGRARWHFFDEEMHADALARLTTEGELRAGLRHNEFVAHYQPIVELATGRIVGHEALVRWVHDGRVRPPGDFLAVAEETGLIVPIGWQVLQAVCRTLAGDPELPGPISVNFSGVQLASRNWLAQVLASIEHVGIEPHRIAVEVTETAVLSLRGSSLATDLARLRDLGVGVHVDDFGTGYSSIALLRELPVTGLKLDRSFVADLTSGPSPANALATGLAGLATGLNLMRIAEGVETQQQAAQLERQGWTYGQGYLFGRPMERPLVQRSSQPVVTT